jgi:transposase
LTFEPGASVALVARAHGVNAKQVFKWRRAFERGELVEPGAAASTALLPVRLSAFCEPAAQEREPAVSTGAIHIELPGRALISVEGRADAVVLRTVLESLRK